MGFSRNSGLEGFALESSADRRDATASRNHSGYIYYLLVSIQRLLILLLLVATLLRSPVPRAIGQFTVPQDFRANSRTMPKASGIGQDEDYHGRRFA